MAMNHSALDLLHTCGRLAALLLQAHSLGSRSFWHLPQSLIVGSPLGLQECAVEWLGQWSASIRYLHLHVMIIESDYAQWLQDSIPRLCAKFGELRPHFDKVSSQSSCECEGGVNQESEKMLYSRYD
jgi:hypothetical protein